MQIGRHLSMTYVRNLLHLLLPTSGRDEFYYNLGKKSSWQELVQNKKLLLEKSMVESESRLVPSKLKHLIMLMMEDAERKSGM